MGSVIHGRQGEVKENLWASYSVNEVIAVFFKATSELFFCYIWFYYSLKRGTIPAEVEFLTSHCESTQKCHIFVKVIPATNTNTLNKTVLSYL